MAPTCLRPLLRYRSFAILFLTPLLLLPLPVAVPTPVSARGAHAGNRAPRVRAPATPRAPAPPPPPGPGLCRPTAARPPSPPVWALLPQSPGPRQPHRALSSLAGRPARLPASRGAVPQTPWAALATRAALAAASPLPPGRAAPDPGQGGSTGADPSCRPVPEALLCSSASRPVPDPRNACCRFRSPMVSRCWC